MIPNHTFECMGGVAVLELDNHPDDNKGPYDALFQRPVP